MADSSSAKLVYQSKTLWGVLAALASLASMASGLDLSSIIGGTANSWVQVAVGALGLAQVVYARIKDGASLAFTASGLQKLLEAVTEAVSSQEEDQAEAGEN